MQRWRSVGTGTVVIGNSGRDEIREDTVIYQYDTSEPKNASCEVQVEVSCIVDMYTACVVTVP